jgi:hypothetical protein
LANHGAYQECYPAVDSRQCQIKQTGGGRGAGVGSSNSLRRLKSKYRHVLSACLDDTGLRVWLLIKSLDQRQLPVALDR